MRNIAENIFIISQNRKDEIVKILKQQGGMDVVIDPFCNLYIDLSLKVLNTSGRYITCGFNNQLESWNNNYNGIPLKECIGYAMVKNLSLYGNCLGVEGDIQNAIHDYSCNKFDILIDNIYSCGQEIEFINRSFNCNDKFGKIVFKY